MGIIGWVILYAGIALIAMAATLAGIKVFGEHDIDDIDDGLLGVVIGGSLFWPISITAIVFFATVFNLYTCMVKVFQGLKSSIEEYMEEKAG